MSATAIHIGQTWQKRTRLKAKPELRITQVHRADREVETVQVLDGGQVVRQRIKFTELRSHYRLVQESAAVPA